MATRLSPSHHGVHFVCDSIEKTMRKSPHSCQIWEARCHDLFADVLGLPTIWIPHSYADCGQYGPDERLAFCHSQRNYENDRYFSRHRRMCVGSWLPWGSRTLIGCTFAESAARLFTSVGTQPPARSSSVARPTILAATIAFVECARIVADPATSSGRPDSRENLSPPKAAWLSSNLFRRQPRVVAMRPPVSRG